MKGIIYVVLADMIQEKYSLREWNEIVDKADVKSKGIYTAAANYDDEEAFSLLKVICEKYNKTSENVLKIFGLYLMKKFHAKYPHFFEQKDLFEFLIKIDSEAHHEFKKISPDSKTPKLLGKIINSHEMILFYHSERKLCHLAEGLIKASSVIFNTAIDIEHRACMHNNHECCEFVIRKRS